MKPFSNVQKTVSVLLKAVVIAGAFFGILLSARASSNDFMGGKTLYMYFTIQSNIAIALLCLAGFYFLLRKKPVPGVWYVIKLVGTISITLTGTVFCFALAPVLGAGVWNPQNILTHVVVPLAAVADFFVTGVNSNLRKSSVFYVLIPPFAYVIYAGIAYAEGWRFSGGAKAPYFFLDWGNPAGAFGFTKEFPFMGCVWWISFAFLALLLIALGYLKILDCIKKYNRKSVE